MIQVEFIDHLLVPNFCNVDADMDVEVRKKVVSILTSMALSCSSIEFFCLINIIEKVGSIQLLSYVSVLKDLC